MRPLLEIAGEAPEQRWGLTIVDGDIVPLESTGLPEPDGWRRMGRLPIKLADYIPVFGAQHFAVLSPRGIPIRAPAPKSQE